MATAAAAPDLLAEGKIMRPVDGAALKESKVDIVASAPEGKLELDGKAIPADELFPVFSLSLPPFVSRFHRRI